MELLIKRSGLEAELVSAVGIEKAVGSGLEVGVPFVGLDRLKMLSVDEESDLAFFPFHLVDVEIKIRGNAEVVGRAEYGAVGIIDSEVNGARDIVVAIAGIERFHNVDFAGGRPGPIQAFGMQHPGGGPHALSGRELGADFDPPVREIKLAERVKSARAVNAR